ncbi:MAG: type I restriction enzyme HsdR N-terminal domain-containing protein [Candidatus Methanoperedens sp.]|nr:type I restriction enzyme HsdR N-terminal domain-containing protein [Candidatus Methanoperedens sp.]
MVSLSNKIQDRLISGIKKFQPVLTSAKSKDINESDTVVIITDMLSEIFGYDKYTEITTEHLIKKTYCDLAIRIDGKAKILIEAKAIGLDLKNEHTKQAIDYGANLGIDWVILTNGYIWQIYKLMFSKPIDKELIYEINFLNMNHKNKDDLESLYFISKEGFSKSALVDYYAQKQALSRFFIGQIILSEPILLAIKKELKKVSPGVKIENDIIKNVLLSEVLKREVLEGEKSDIARKKINKILNSSVKRTNPTDISINDSPKIEINEENIV